MNSNREIKTRGAKTKRERLIAALNSSDQDIFIDAETDRVVVTGKTLEREIIFLGDFCQSVFLQKTGLNIRDAIEKIRFGAWPKVN